MADLGKAKVTSAQAVCAAETQANKCATRDELDGERGGPLYRGELVDADEKVFNVTIGAVYGKVLSSKLDQPDSGDCEDQED